MIKIKEAKPLYTGLFVTSDRFDEDQTDKGIIIHYKGEVSPYQKVYKVGPFVKNVNEGDYVKINFARYTKYKYGKDDIQSEMPVKNEKTVFVPEVEIDGVSYFHIEENDVLFVITDYEEVPNSKIVQLGNHGLIL